MLGFRERRDRSLIDALAVHLNEALADEGQVETLGRLRRLRALQPGTAIALAPGAAPTRLGALTPTFTGFATALEPSESGETRGTRLTILDRWRTDECPTAPPDFKVLAVMTAFNEADIVVTAIRRLVAQRIGVHLIDNWSTDGTAELVRDSFEGSEVTLERFPPDGPVDVYEWTRLLQRKDAVGAESDADWVIHHDPDELRESPWPGQNLRDALYAVDRAGFNCVNHMVLDFRPVSGDVQASDPFESMRWFEWPRRPAQFVQLKAWRRQASGVDLAASGGHAAAFPGRKIFPYKFLLRHYPIRSQEHGMRKVLAERQQRWHPGERAAGWHGHYDAFDVESSFVWDRDGLALWDEGDFHARWLVQRISGVGVADGPQQLDLT